MKKVYYLFPDYFWHGHYIDRGATGRFNAEWTMLQLVRLGYTHSFRCRLEIR